MKRMGVRYGKEYDHIIDELIVAIGDMDQFYVLLEMTEADWVQLDDVEQRECLKTLADDVFFGLGADPLIHLGKNTILHDNNKHTIQISYGGKVTRIIYLV
jgi:hypothetical protein